MSGIKKNVLSGAQKRKIRREKEHSIAIKYAKLDTFFLTSANKSSEPEQPLETKNIQEQSADLVVSECAFKKHVVEGEEAGEKQEAGEEQEVLVSSDLAFYTNVPIDTELREKILKLGPCQPEDFFRKDAKGRSFSSSYYNFTTKTGQKVQRKWLCYSIRLDAAYCQVCWLFADRNNIHFKEAWCKGVNDWQGISKKIKEHENSIIHIQACRAFDIWEENKTVDLLLDCKYKEEVNKLRQTLRRVIDVIMTLATCNLPLRGHRENRDSLSRGNFLNIIDLLAKYDPVLKVHLLETNAEKFKISYLSPKIQNELIHDIGSKVRENIVKNIKECPFFTIILDTTQDIAKKDQLSTIIRYVSIELDENDEPSNIKINESFLGFSKVTDQTAKSLENDVINLLSTLDIDLTKCRGQGYDGAANMSGAYGGLQKLIKDRQPTASYIHCAAHNLNLVLNDACINVPFIREFYDLCQKIYTFFGHSIKRWNDLKIVQNNENIKLTLKSLCATRWSSRFESVISIRYNFVEILKVLSNILLISTKREEKQEASVIKKHMEKFEFVFLLIFQCEILERINLTSKTLQKADTDLENAMIMINSSLTSVRNLRDKFADIKEKASTEARRWSIIPKFEQKRYKKVRKCFEELSTDERLQNTERLFEVEVFKASIDIITSQLNNRFESMSDINQKFNFLSPKNIAQMANDTLYNSANNLQKSYSHDLSTEFPNQILSLKAVFTEDLIKLKSIKELGDFLLIKNKRAAASLPDICNAILLFLTLPVTVAMAERSFSKLKLIKNYLRSTMSEERLCDLSLISIEQEHARKLDLDDLINNFAKKNARRQSRFL